MPENQCFRAHAPYRILPLAVNFDLTADIHENVITLRRALAHLAELRLDKIVLLPSFVPAIRRCR